MATDLALAYAEAEQRHTQHAVTVPIRLNAQREGIMTNLKNPLNCASTYQRTLKHFHPTRYWHVLFASIAQATIILVVSSVYAAAWAQPPCKAIELQADGTPTSIAGTVAPEEINCFSFKVDVGKMVRIDVKSNDSNTIIFSVPGLVDAQKTYEFISQKTSYEVIVGQLMRSVTPDTYQLTLSVK